MDKTAQYDFLWSSKVRNEELSFRKAYLQLQVGKCQGFSVWLCVKGQWRFFGEKINLGDEGVKVLGMKLILIHT